MTDADAAAEALVAGARKHIAETIAPLEARLAELESRLAELEAGGIKYCGIYQRANTYKRGSVVTEAGSAWIALRDVAAGEMPAEEPGAWHLMVKRGRDARPQREASGE